MMRCSYVKGVKLFSTSISYNAEVEGISVRGHCRFIEMIVGHSLGQFLQQNEASIIMMLSRHPTLYG